MYAKICLKDIIIDATYTVLYIRRPEFVEKICTNDAQSMGITVENAKANRK
jgi:hypothetical protein